MDHRELLKKYMNHVVEEEGTAFVYPHGEALMRERFTKEQRDELRLIQAELDAEWESAR